MPNFRSPDSWPASRAGSRPSRPHGRDMASWVGSMSAKTASCRVVPPRALPQRAPLRPTSPRVVPLCPEPSSPVPSSPSPAPSSPAIPAPQNTLPEVEAKYSDSQPRIGTTLDTNPSSQPSFFPIPEEKYIVCRRPIEPSYQKKDTWKNYHQPMVLSADSDQLVPSEQYRVEYNAYIHSCCWKVV